MWGSGGFPFPWAPDPQFGSELTRETARLTPCPGLAGWPHLGPGCWVRSCPALLPSWERRARSNHCPGSEGQATGGTAPETQPSWGTGLAALEPHLLKGARKDFALNKPSLKPLPVDPARLSLPFGSQTPTPQNPPSESPGNSHGATAGHGRCQPPLIPLCSDSKHLTGKARLGSSGERVNRTPGTGRNNQQKRAAGCEFKLYGRNHLSVGWTVGQLESL